MHDIHVKVENVQFLREERTIFDNLSLEIPRGKITAIMGPSGCGKTTLLELIGGMLQPNSGSILVNDVNVHQLGRRRLYNLRRSMGLLFQTGGLFTNLSVFENVAFPLREHTDLPEPMLRDLVLMKLEAVGLRGARDLMPSALSGGMARRVAMARALALDPELMMYDEPFTGQDPVTMSVLVQLIKQLNQALGLTSIVISHDVPETASIADYIYLLGQGRVIAKGTPEEIFADKTPSVYEFMHGLDAHATITDYPAVSYAEDLGDI